MSHPRHMPAGPYPFDDDDEEAPVPRLAKQAFWALLAQLRALLAWLSSIMRARFLYARALALLFLQQPGPTAKHVSKWLSRRIFTIPSAIIIVWFFMLYRGEYSVFEDSLAQCDWPKWEDWPSRAMPHRIAFVADPQLVDPHTYPGRPWPLSTLTVMYTDIYLRRAYSRIQRDLDPNSILFLGDLFDGGREWSTPTSQSPEERYRKYGETFWQKEYRRFSKIFFRDWRDNPSKTFRPEELVENTRIIASLPGNHDLGFGATIAIPVRERFTAFFGDSNRVDIIGNHTFVSLDTVSLSARDQQGSDPNIYRPAEEFLENAKSLVHETERNHIRSMNGEIADATRHSQAVEDADAIMKRHERTVDDSASHFPTILLTHVPLHRPQGTPCGPLREHWPPTEPPPGQTDPVFPDDRNSLHVDGGFGWQYQNVLTQPTSHYILDRLGGAVSRAFSGDDHDYCAVVHRAYPSPGAGVAEITVKSLSWAMGVRRPGFVLASLWHELDAAGRPAPRRPGEPDPALTLQSHLCLLPDQLAVFINYAILFGLTLVALLARAVYAALGPPQPPAPDLDALPLLPLAAAHPPPPDSSASRDKKRASSPLAGPAAGAAAAPVLAGASAGAGYALPPRASGAAHSLAGSARARAAGAPFGFTTDVENPLDMKPGRGLRGAGRGAGRVFWERFGGGLWGVARVVVPVYLLMLRW